MIIMWKQHYLCGNDIGIPRILGNRAELVRVNGGG